MKISNLGNIDKNFQVSTALSEEDIVFLDAKCKPFSIYGLYNNMNEYAYLRIPKEIACRVNEGVRELNYHTSGGRIRFSTNSRYIAIKYATKNTGLMSHMPLLGSSGFDLYIDADGKSTYYKSFMPPIDFTNGYESIVYFENTNEDNKDMFSITINFPLYNSIDSLFIGLQQDSIVEEGAKYKYENPVVYYGSSITQGGCASRPGNSYSAIISRWLDCDYINLGFSGSARGEEIMAQYIASLKMSVFVLDYDHNAPSIEHLENTHKKFYTIIRESNKKLPIIILSKPDYENGLTENKIRKDIIYKTYKKAVDQGDKNVFLIDGELLFGTTNRDSCTVDGCHPNDLGFMRMAETIYPYIQRHFNNKSYL
jgi:hypothetical protein